MRFSIRIGAVLAAITGSAFAQTFTLEAEDGVLTGTTALTEVAGFTGSGYVGGWDTDGDNVVLSFNSAETKLYDVKIRYSGPYGSKYTRISYNGVTGGDISLPETEEWATVDAGQALLNAGANSIRLDNNWGWYLIDAVILSPSVPRGPHKVTDALVNRASNAEAKALMKFLVSKYQKAYLSGQQDPPSYRWVEENVGKSPAVLGLDMIEYSPSRVEFGSTSTAVEDAIAFDRRGGIVTFCWHWNAPSGLINTEGHEWWRGFYTEHTTFDVEAALADTTNANYRLLIRDIDAIAVQLKRLQDAGVPVLWRPLHEAEGKWFWWGAKGPEACKKLYKILYERLTNHHQLNNLIWVWNSVAADWYPGADVVDVLSYDSYPAQTGDHGPVSAQYNALVALGEDKKLIAATEVGPIPDPDLMQVYQAYWSFFCVWNGEFIQNGIHNSLDYVKRVYNNSFVLNLDAIQGWKSAGGSTTTATTVRSTTTTTPTTTPTTISTIRSTTTTTPTTISTATTPAPTATQVAKKWQQCGGVGYQGPTVCEAGTTCKDISPPYYYQCL